MGHHSDARAVPAAVAALRAGRPVLVSDDAGREDEGDVVLAAALADPRWTAWTVRRTSGLLCTPLPGERADALELHPMAHSNQDPHGTAYTVSVDAADGVTTGISAADRARTARVLADPATRPADLRRPGHVIPLRACDGGVLERRGHTEAGVDLCRLAGLPPVALIAELVAEGGGMASRGAVASLGAAHDLPVLTIADLVTHRLFHGDGERARVTRGATTRLPTPYGELSAVGFRDEATGAEHLALVGAGAGTHPLAAVHAECVLGDVFGAAVCSCARELDHALARIAAEGGIVVYVRRPGARILAPDGGTHAWTESDDGAAAAVLSALGATAVRLLPGPTDPAGLARGGVDVLPTAWTPDALPSAPTRLLEVTR